MANAYGNGVRVQREAAGTWVVYKNGINEGSFTNRPDAQNVAMGLAGTNPADRFGNKTAAGEVQVITLAAFSGTDSFSLVVDDVNTVAFVRGTNATAAALQTAIRTATGDTTLTVTGTTDEGPFTVTFVSETTAQRIIRQGTVSGCTLTVARTTLGGTGR